MRMKLCKLVFSYLLIVSMISVPVIAAGSDSKDVSDEWNPDIRLSIADEHQLMKEAGMNLDSWDSAVAKAMQDGFSNPITEAALKDSNGDVPFKKENDQIYYIGKSTLFGKVPDAIAAYHLAYQLVDILGGSSDTELLLRLKITMNNNTIYTFCQMCDFEEVLGGGIKIALDENDEVTAVFSCIDSEKENKAERISRIEAEEIAVSNCKKNSLETEVYSEYTERIYRCPVTIGELLNLDYQDYMINELVWVVYTKNTEGEEKPYLAHYIKLDGTYIISFPVKEPSDQEARGGYPRKDIFEGLIADTFTGVVTDAYGNERTVTIPVMRSESEGCWYLGDLDRRIAVADFYEAAYGENHDIVLVKSEDNKDWDNHDIYTLYNYIRANDFYSAMGWNGPDGMGTDQIILKELRFRNGNVYENAAFVGKFNGWVFFGYTPYGASGNPTNLTLALDVMVHEYTHAFTTTVMMQNMYENDTGAINEAMSDIIGNLAEYICNDTEDTTWLLGENMGCPVRSMLNPEDFSQPSSVWGRFYTPRTDKPSDMNDRGGVHYNSSLLNYFAAKLCTEYGMSYQEAVSLWIMAAVGMAPKIDYIQMEALISWAMEQSLRSDKYKEALTNMIDETRIYTTELPDKLPKGQKMIMLEYPDTEAFENKNWVLLIYQYKLKTPVDRLWDIFEFFRELFVRTKDETEQALTDFDVETEIDRRLEALQNDQLNAMLTTFASEIMNYWIKSVTYSICYEDMDTGVVPSVVMDEPSVYLLANFSDEGLEIRKTLLFVDGGWLDVTDKAQSLHGNMKLDESWIELVSRAVSYAIKTVYKYKFINFWDNLFNSSEEFPIEYLPSTGLKSIQLE